MKTQILPSQIHSIIKEKFKTDSSLQMETTSVHHAQRCPDRPRPRQVTLHRVCAAVYTIQLRKRQNPVIMKTITSSTLKENK